MVLFVYPNNGYYSGVLTAYPSLGVTITEGADYSTR